MSCTVRPCSAADLERLLAAGLSPWEARHHRERFALAEAGQAVYLLAWRGGELVGRGTMLAVSKYETVRQQFGRFPELNALEATPPGQGTGTALIARAEQAARALGTVMIGLAVEVSNAGACRLYERLGYRDWGHGLVTDYWDETEPDGTVRLTHADSCQYLIKALA